MVGVRCGSDFYQPLLRHCDERARFLRVVRDVELCQKVGLNLHVIALQNQALPIEQVEPTPYQRNLSDTHARKLEGVIAKLGRFLDPIIVVRKEVKDSATRYWTPNGNHRLKAMN